MWKVVEATWESVEDAIDEWEAKFKCLEEHGRYNMSEDDRVHGLLEIIPADLRVMFLDEQEKGKSVDYDYLREEIPYRVETHNKHKGARRST